MHSRNMDFTHYHLNERPDAFVECSADEFANLSFWGQSSVVGMGWFRELINPSAPYENQVWVNWQVFFHNRPQENLHGYAFGIGQRNGKLFEHPQAVMYYAHFGHHHEWRAMTAQEVREHGIKLYMFDNACICDKCGATTIFDSSG